MEATTTEVTTAAADVAVAATASFMDSLKANPIATIAVAAVTGLAIGASGTYFWNRKSIKFGKAMQNAAAAGIEATVGAAETVAEKATEAATDKPADK